jgi:hypothetical protein
VDLSRLTAAVHGLDEVVHTVRALGRRVITFGGYGELGYEDEPRVLALCRHELGRHDPRSTLINTGTLVTHGFRQGIALVYPLARSLGFTTIGVHPSVALVSRKRHCIADGVDRAFFVDDPTWGGCDERGQPSNTLRALLAVSDEFVAIGGGEHTAQELRAFLRAGKAVRFHAANMHSATTERWTRETGVHIPDLAGAAQRTWLDEQLPA